MIVKKSNIKSIIQKHLKFTKRTLHLKNVNEWFWFFICKRKHRVKLENYSICAHKITASLSTIREILKSKEVVEEQISKI